MMEPALLLIPIVMLSTPSGCHATQKVEAYFRPGRQTMRLHDWQLQ
jgi:hypothetical protein